MLRQLLLLLLVVLLLPVLKGDSHAEHAQERSGQVQDGPPYIGNEDHSMFKREHRQTRGPGTGTKENKGSWRSHREEGHGHSQGSHQDAIYPSPPECAVIWLDDSQNSSSPRRKRSGKKRRQEGKSGQKETPMKQQSSQQEQQVLREMLQRLTSILEAQKKQNDDLNNDLRQQNNDLNNDLRQERQQNNDLRQQNNDLNNDLRQERQQNNDLNNDLRHREEQLLSKLKESNALMRTEQESQRRQDAKQERVALRFVNVPKPNTRIYQKDMITGENGDPLHIEIWRNEKRIEEGALASVKVNILAVSNTVNAICSSILKGDELELKQGSGSLNISFTPFTKRDFGNMFRLKARVDGNSEVEEANTGPFEVVTSRTKNNDVKRATNTRSRRATNTRNDANRQSPPMSGEATQAVHYTNENCNNTAAVIVGPRASPTLHPNHSACPSSAPDVLAARNCFGGNNGGVSGESGMPNMQMLSHHTTYGNCSGQATGEIGGQHIISSTPAVEHHRDQPSNVQGTGLGDENSRAIITSSGRTCNMNDASGYGGSVYSQPTIGSNRNDAFGRVPSFCLDLPEVEDLEDFEALRPYLA